MKIAEVYKKYFEQDLLDEFNYPESVAGYNEALNIVISNSGLGIQDLISLLNEKRKEFVGILKSFDASTITIAEGEEERTFAREEIAKISLTFDF